MSFFLIIRVIVRVRMSFLLSTTVVDVHDSIGIRHLVSLSSAVAATEIVPQIQSEGLGDYAYACVPWSRDSIFRV